MYSQKLMDMEESTRAAKEIIDNIIKLGGERLYMKYIDSQIIPYASRTLTTELVMNATWASFPLGENDVEAIPDDDLEMPLIDEWAGGVLPVRGSDSSGLRVSVTPSREVKKNTATIRRPKTTLETPISNTTKNQLSKDAAHSFATTSQRAKSRQQTNKKPIKVVKITEAEKITKIFDEAKKKTNVTMKQVTVDSDFSVIQISEPKGLPPAIIVPKVSTNKKTNVGKNDKRRIPISVPKASSSTVKNASLHSDSKEQQIQPKPSKPIQTFLASKQKKKKRPQVKIIETDNPVFDEDVADISYSDNFVCAPGVTFKDGNTVKSRPPNQNKDQMTRAQYEQYLDEMKKIGENE